MYQNFKEIQEKVRKLGPKHVAVLFPDNPDVMTAVFEGADKGLIKPKLVGNYTKIEMITQQFNIKPGDFKIIDEKEPQKASDKCIDMAKTGIVAFVVKGNIITSYLYRSLIRHTKMSTPDQTPCTLSFHQADNIKKVFIITNPNVKGRLIIMKLICENLEKQYQEFDDLVSGLNKKQWHAKTLFFHWTIFDQVAHIAFFAHEALLSIERVPANSWNVLKVLCRLLCPVKAGALITNSLLSLDGTSEFLNYWRNIRNRFTGLCRDISADSCSGSSVG